MPTVFEFIDDLSLQKEYILKDSNQKDYIPYIVNRHFSLFPDTFLLSEKMNRSQNLSKLQHFDYYFNSVSKQKRFKKWPKRERSDDVKVLCEYYNISRLKASEIIHLFDSEKIAEIKEIMKKE